MPDYAACAHLTCERRYGCARYLMTHGRWQTVVYPGPETCSMFWDSSDRVPFAMLSPERADEQALQIYPPPAAFAAIPESETP